VRYHFLRDNVEKGKITLIHVPTHDQLADIFTKPLDQATFTRLWGNFVCVWFLELGVWELSFAGGVEPVLPPLEEPVVCELWCGSSFVAYV
jgi:hypothetical protein